MFIKTCFPWASCFVILLFTQVVCFKRVVTCCCIIYAVLWHILAWNLYNYAQAKNWSLNLLLHILCVNHTWQAFQALASFWLLAAKVNMFCPTWGSFSHAQNKHALIVIYALHHLMWTPSACNETAFICVKTRLLARIWNLKWVSKICYN